MPKNRSRVTQALKRKVTAIIKEHSDYIPVHYVEDVQNTLKKWNYSVSDQRVKDVRTGRGYDLRIAEALRQVASECRHELGSDDGTISTAAELGLSK